MRKPKPRDADYQSICAIPQDAVVDPRGWAPERIILAKGVLDNPAYRAYVDRVLRQFPNAEVVEALDRSWNSADLLKGVPFAERFDLGKRTLVLGTRGRFITTFPGIFEDVRCPSFERSHFQDLCPFSCAYCYLTASTTSRMAPQVKIFVNLDDMFSEIATAVQRRGRLFLSAGELQDSLAIDWFAGQARRVVEFFAGVNAKVLFLTKSDKVDGILDADHRGHTILSWSLNTDKITRTIEAGTAPLARRLDAARRAQAAGYPIRYRIDPILADGPDWTPGRDAEYRDAVRAAFDAARPERVTLGSFRAVDGCKNAHEARVQAGRVERAVTDRALAKIGGDRRWRFKDELRFAMYHSIISEIRALDPEVPIALCKETLEFWHRLGLDPTSCKCNCVDEGVDLTLDPSNPARTPARGGDPITNRYRAGSTSGATHSEDDDA